MAVEIRVPPLGESLVDAVVGQWLKEEGDAVSRGETILELETDKVNLDVTASDDGEIGKIERKEGDVVEVGDLLATLNAGSSAGASNGASAPAETAAEEPTEPVAAASAESESAADTETAESVSADGAGRAAPAVRRLAEEHHIDLANLSGTGPGGRVTREDVIAAASDQPDEAQTETATAPPAPEPAPEPESAQPESKPESKPAPKSTPAPVAKDSGRPEERVRMTRRRQTIANRLVEAQHTAAMLTTFNEIDMSAVMALRSERKEAFKEEHGVNLGFMSFFTKATVGALKAFPYLNAEIDGDEIVLKHYYDVGIAVGVEEGLVVPVLRDADRKNFAEIESGIRDLAVRAQEGTLELSELMGGTFTITNGGVYGSLMSTPILNTPQVGILGMHAIQERPVAIDGKMVIRPMMYVALSYDHRIVDGGDAVRFLVRIKEFVEDPTRLLLEG